MQETLQAILEEVRKKAPLLSARAEFEAYKATISGPNGALTQAMKEMGRVPKEEKPALGRLINEVKGQITTLFDEVVERIVAAELSEKLGPAIDPTLPLPDPNRALCIQSRRCGRKSSLSFVVSVFLWRRRPR